jgi:uncharacterized phage-associated protein
MKEGAGMKREIYTAEQIAQWFILHNQRLVEKNEADLLSNLKLQKLLYYAQGTSLALNGSPLFAEAIEAWDHGPVVRKLYNEYRKFGANGIAPDNVIMETIELDSMADALLQGVYEKYNKYSAFELVKKTHEEKPWVEAERNEEIPIDVISDYFKSTIYKKVLDGTIFDTIPIAEPLYVRDDGVSVYSSSAND